MTRKEKQEKAKQKRKEAKEKLLSIAQKTLKKTGSLRYTIEEAERELNMMIRVNPQEKSLLLSITDEFIRELILFHLSIIREAKKKKEIA